MVDRLTESEQCSHVNPFVVLREALSVCAIRRSARYMLTRASNDSAKCAVECIANPSGAIVAVVVVMVEAIFGSFIPLDELHERRALRRSEVELLCPHRTVRLAVLVDGRLEIKASHPVEHVAF